MEERYKAEERREIIGEEWRKISRILDKFLLIVFTCASLITTLWCIFVSPHYPDADAETYGDGLVSLAPRPGEQTSTVLWNIKQKNNPHNYQCLQNLQSLILYFYIKYVLVAGLVNFLCLFYSFIIVGMYFMRTEARSRTSKDVWQTIINKLDQPLSRPSAWAA